MSGMSKPGRFTLTFDPDGTAPGNLPAYPNGYWYAVSSDGGYDADGATPVDALAGLVVVMDKALRDRR